jgi:predicted helicase
MKEVNYLFPLYLYSAPEQRGEHTLFGGDVDPVHGEERVENFSTKFRAFIDRKYTNHYSPEAILGYIYAVLHSPTYRKKYLEFLKTDFPRIPFVEDAETFETLSALGWELVQAHLLHTIPESPEVDVSKGSVTVEKPVYEESRQRLYINKERYFAPVPREVWEFHIGGYPVLEKYLKSRKDRDLTLDEIEHVQNVVKVLAFTLRQMQKIDATWNP